MKKFFIVWVGVAIVMFVIGATIGENKGTPDSFMYWWIIGWTGLGLVYLLLRVFAKAFTR